MFKIKLNKNELLAHQLTKSALETFKKVLCEGALALGSLVKALEGLLLR